MYCIDPLAIALMFNDIKFSVFKQNLCHDLKATMKTSVRKVVAMQPRRLIKYENNSGGTY